MFSSLNADNSTSPVSSSLRVVDMSKLSSRPSRAAQKTTCPECCAKPCLFFGEKSGCTGLSVTIPIALEMTGRELSVTALRSVASRLVDSASDLELVELVALCLTKMKRGDGGLFRHPVVFPKPLVRYNQPFFCRPSTLEGEPWIFSLEPSEGMIETSMSALSSLGEAPRDLPPLPAELGSFFDRVEAFDDTDLNPHLANVVNGKTVVVTGAGGSIGSQVCMRLLREPGLGRLILLGRGEGSLFEVRSRLKADPRAVCVVLDIRDEGAMKELFGKYSPKIVIHAAAHKHVGFCQDNVAEAISNNVGGTSLLLHLSAAFNVEAFVLVSTDKAVAPSSVMGTTKRVAELLMRQYSHSSSESGMRCVTVRFGNVLGSRGSVLPAFRARLLQNQPLTVTDRNSARYFISADEACRLVLMALAQGHSGDILSLKMGQQVPIVQLAEWVLRQHGSDLPIEWIGLQPGEKLREEICGANEVMEEFPFANLRVVRNTSSPRPSKEDVAEFQTQVDVLLNLAAVNEAPDALYGQLKVIVPEFTTGNGIIVRERASGAWPFLCESGVRRASGVLRSGRVNQWTGSEVTELQKAFATFVGTQHAVAVANGTVALELALIAANFKSGDHIVVPARTYVATASCVVARGGIPIVADVDPVSGLITAATIEAVLTPQTRGIIVVHIAGWPCDMDPIMQLAARKSLFVVEDCAQALGSKYKGRSVGSLGHFGAFSLCQDKMITGAGEGGVLCMNDDAAWRRAWAHKDIGRDYDAVFSKNHPPGFRWLTHNWGTNWRMTEVQAAVARLQLARLPDWIILRARNASILIEALAEFTGRIEVPLPSSEDQHCFYRLYAYAPNESLRDSIIGRAGSLIQSGTCCEIYRERCFDVYPSSKSVLPVAQSLTATSLSFRVHPTISRATMEDQARIIVNAIKITLDEYDVKEDSATREC